MIILHIGLHKAGSTTVQTYLRDNADALAKAGVLYPAIGRAERSIAHHRLAADLRGGAADPEQWAAILQLAQDNPDKPVVIASEGFQNADPVVVRAMFADHPVKVFCYHRDAAQRFISVYGHGAKNGFRSTEFDTVFKNQFAMKRTYIGETIQAWAGAFGADNVRVRSLHPSCLANGDLISDLFEVLGLGPDAEKRFGLRKVGARNVTPGWKALEVLRGLYHDLGPGRPDPETTPDGRTARSALLNRALQAEVKLGLTGKGLYLTDEQMRQMIELEDKDIADMQAAGVDCKLRPITLDGFEPRPFLPEFSRVPGDEAAALLREMLSGVVRDYVLRPARVADVDAEGETDDDEDAAAVAAAPRSKGQRARDKRIKVEAAAGQQAEGGVTDPMKLAKQQAKAERLARREDRVRVQAGQAAARDQNKTEKQAGREAAAKKAKA